METVQCMECRGMFSTEDVIRHGNAYVCAKCKPIFMQKLAEGTLRTSQFRYAGFWRRVLSSTIDNIILGVFNVILRFASILPAVTGVRAPRDLGMIFLIYAIEIGISITYHTVLIGKYGTTVGKMACQMEVVTADGGRVSYGLAFGRYFAKMLSGLMLGIGYIMAAFDSEKRALHDRICDTRVIVK